LPGEEKNASSIAGTMFPTAVGGRVSES
jgi:hypothetical protein